MAKKYYARYGKCRSISNLFKNLNKETYDWNQGVQDVKKYIGRKIDVVFAGSDYQGQNLWETLYKESKVIYFDRGVINISSTEIRRNPYQYFDYLPDCVKKYYTKKGMYHWYRKLWQNNTS